MSQSAVIQTILNDASIQFGELGKQLFAPPVLPGEYGNYTNTVTGVTALTTKLSVITNIPLMQQWNGARVSKRPRAFSQTITLKPYVATLPIQRTMLQYQDQQGQVTGLIKRFYDEQKGVYDDTTHGVYVSSSGAGPTGFDGVALFHAAHPYGPAGATQANLGALPFTIPNLDTTIAAMMSWQFENGRNMRIRPTHVRCGPKLANTVTAACNAGMRVVVVNASGAEASSGIVAASPMENVFKGQLTPIVDPLLVGAMDDWWEVLDLSKGEAKPMQMFIGRAPEVWNQDQMTDPSRFENDEFRFGVEGDFNADAGLWPTAYRHVL